MYQIAGLNFDHGHVDLLLDEASRHSDAEVVAVCDEQRDRSMADIEQTAANLGLSDDRVYENPDTCLAETEPDVAVLCPATGVHAEWVERVARHDVHVLLEKPFAASLEDADRILDAMAETENRLAINWPLAWYPPHRTAARLIDDDEIGEVLEVHFYDGNDGEGYPGSHPWALGNGGDARELLDRSAGWFYDPELGGGSLLDYLGYGVTLATWFRDGELPNRVNATTYTPDGLGVDEQSVTVAEYDRGLSTFQTRWGTFTSPWDGQPEPKCGFRIVGTEGTIGSFDYQDSVRLQTADCPQGREVPVDDLEHPYEGPIDHFLHCINSGEELTPPLSPSLNRRAQRIVEAAVMSAGEDRTVSLPN